MIGTRQEFESGSIFKNPAQRATRQDFEEAVQRPRSDWQSDNEWLRWTIAYRNFNGLNMTDMLRSLDAFSPTELETFWGKSVSFATAVEKPRMEYAVTVVKTRGLPATAPGDLLSTGQVRDARNFLVEVGGKTSPYNQNRTAPPLMDWEDSTAAQPKEFTLYLNISVAKGVTPMTAVYVPDFSQLTGSSINVLLYLRGNKDGAKNSNADGKFMTIQGYLQDKVTANAADKRFLLREEIQGGKNKKFLFVAPTLPGNAENPNSLMTGAADVQDYLKQVMAGLAAYGPLATTPAADNIVVAAHSGGGLTMLKMATFAGLNVNEIWGFDCLYYDWSPLPAWKLRKPDARLWNYALGGSTLVQSRALKTVTDAAMAKGKYQKVEITLGGAPKLPFAGAGKTPPFHGKVPLTFLKDLIDSSSILS
jgi:hypothetical protein